MFFVFTKKHPGYVFIIYPMKIDILVLSIYQQKEFLENFILKYQFSLQLKVYALANLYVSLLKCGKPFE